MLQALRQPVPVVVQQHVDDAGMLRQARSFLVRAPHVKLHLLRRADERLAAHLDGIAVAGATGLAMSVEALQAAGRGSVFVVAGSAVALQDEPLLRKLLALAQAVPQARAGWLSALGWMPAAALRSTVSELLAAPDPFSRMSGIAACTFHGVDPGGTLMTDAGATDARLRAWALRAAGERGRVDLLPDCRSAFRDGDAGGCFHAARSAALLGDRHASVALLHSLMHEKGPYATAALGLLLKMVAPAQGVAVLRDLTDPRLLAKGFGLLGDPQAVPWLLSQMDNEAMARVAGEAFSMITGLDLAALDLDRKPPEGGAPMPDDDAANEAVAGDEDDGLPWPDPGALQEWWASNAGRFEPGARCFVGAPPTVHHCLRVLREGFQRQRIAAAEHLCLLQPGTPLFPTAAPAWRQRDWLDAMST